MSAIEHSVPQSVLWSGAPVEHLFPLTPQAPPARYDFQVLILLERARGILALLEQNGQSVDGFDSAHTDIVAALFAVDSLVEQAQQLVRLTDAMPAEGDPT